MVQNIEQSRPVPCKDCIKNIEIGDHFQFRVDSDPSGYGEPAEIQCDSMSMSPSQNTGMLTPISEATMLR
jgi:hypothetical protein